MSNPIRSIVLGLAGLSSDDPASGPLHADPALAAAASLARWVGATLHVVHAYELPVLAGGARAAQACRAYRDAIDARVAEQVALWKGVAAVRHVVEGSAAAAICGVADAVGADLVVVGATRRGRTWRTILGSTADGVVRSARMPVLVLHEPLHLPIARVLLTTDLSPESGALLARGMAAVRALAAGEVKLRLLLVVVTDPLAHPDPLADATARAAEPEVRRLAGRIDGGAESRIRIGEASLEIAREAGEWGAELIVLGRHGRGGHRPAWLGGTAASVLRGASCNLLVLNGPAVPLGAAPATGERKGAGELAGVS